MDTFEEKGMMEKRPFAKDICYDLLINYICEPIKNQQVVLKTKLRVFLKETQLKTIVNQCMLTLCMDVERNQENQN